jgi:hypothetical protein
LGHELKIILVSFPKYYFDDAGETILVSLLEHHFDNIEKTMSVLLQSIAFVILEK